MLLHKLGSFGFSDAYVSWFRSYLTNRRSRVRVCGTLSQPFQVTSGVPQGSVLGPFLFNLFINDLCSSVQYCKIPIFADDVKIFRVINSPHDCLLLHSDINSVSDWCTANFYNYVLLQFIVHSKLCLSIMYLCISALAVSVIGL
jgi:hypothetical protein